MLRKNFHKYIRVTIEKLFFIFLIIIPFLFFFNRDITVYSIFICCFLWIIRLNFKIFLKDLKENNLIKIYVGLYIVFFVSIIYSENLKEAFKHLEIKAGLLVFPLILGINKIKNQNLLKYIFYSFFAGWIIKFFISLIKTIINYYILEKNNIFNFLNEFHYIITNFHKNLNFHYVYFSVAYIIIYIFISEFLINKKNLLAFLGFTFISYIFILILQSRIAMLIIFLVSEINFLRLTIFKSKLSKYKNFSIIIFYNLLLIFFLYYFYNYTKILDRFKNKSMNIRAEIFDLSLDSINNFDFLFGDGLGDSHSRLFKSYKTHNENTYLQEKLNYHNQYLEIFFSNGIIGLLYFVFMLFYLIYLSLKKKKYMHTLFIITMVISFITESWLNVFNGVFLFTFFNSILSFYYLNNENI